LRTILTALSAQQNNPVFSAKELSTMFADKEIEQLLSTKREHGYIPSSYKKLKKKLFIYSGIDGESLPRNLYDQLNYFTLKENKMAEKTISSIINNLDENDYT
ncbi:hypothetical protein, partial [Pseudomonas viridiflava]|uniref:hypothetical protein n=1 Tax=Pseudomonas viridiflava TaxID=33069 RepID=UPI0013CECBB7